MPLRPAWRWVAPSSRSAAWKRDATSERQRTLPWAIVFTSPGAVPGTPLGVPLHPTQIYASLAEFVLFVVLLWLAASSPSRWRNPGSMALSGRHLQLPARLPAGRRRGRRALFRPDHGHAAGRRGDGARWVASWLHRPPSSAGLPWWMTDRRLRQLSVPEEANGQRLDLFLAQQLHEISRSRVQLLLEQGSVLIDGKPGQSVAQSARRREVFPSWAIPSRLLCAPSPRRFRWRLSMKTATLRWSISRPA